MRASKSRATPTRSIWLALLLATGCAAETNLRHESDAGGDGGGELTPLAPATDASSPTEAGDDTVTAPETASDDPVDSASSPLTSDSVPTAADTGSPSDTDTAADTDAGPSTVPECIDNAGQEIGVENCSGSISVTTPSQLVTATYVRVEGTAAGITLPMWYEVFDGNGQMTDFGAFAQDPAWFFIARHLSAGANDIVVYGASTPNAIATATLRLTIDVSGQPAIRPRPRPAELWWGGTANNAQLKDNPDQWPFVKQHADAFFFHTAAWGDEMNPTMQSVVEQLRPYGGKFVAELGGQTGTDAGWPNQQHMQWGAGSNGWLVNRYNTTGLILSEVTHDFHPRVKDFAAAYPAWSQAQIVDTMGDYWKQYFTLNDSVFPHLKHADTHSPVWWNWREYKALGGDLRDDDYVFSSNGVDYNFDYYDIMSALRTAAAEIPGHTEWAFYSDFPYYTMVWPADAPYDGAHVRQKTYAYEQWLHSVGARHTMVVIEDPQDQCPNLDAVQQKFATNGFEAFKLYQRENGRADRYELESWYSCEGIGWVPTRVTPEDEQYSYTWLAKQSIKYLKGIKDTSGALESMSLTQSTDGSSTTFTLRNDGDIICLPNLQSIESGDPAISTQWLDAAGNDISAAMQSAGGWVFTTMLNPGETTSVRCVASAPAGAGEKTIQLEAFWNPQDPTAIVRAREVLVLRPTR